MISIEEGFHGGKYARRYTLAKFGDRSHSHRHTFDHHTILCSRFAVYENGKWHQFEVLEDGATYICTHQLRKPDGATKAVNPQFDLQEAA